MCATLIAQHRRTGAGVNGKYQDASRELKHAANKMLCSNAHRQQAINGAHMLVRQ